MTNGLTREQLTAKYGIDNSPQPSNAIVNAIYAGDSLVASALGAHELQVDPLLISAVITDPSLSPKMHTLVQEMMRDLHATAAEKQIDLSERQVWVCQRPAIASGARMCDVKAAQDCARAGSHLLPIAQGAFVLVLVSCDPCRARLEQTVHDNMILSQLEAQAQLPPGAHIDPRSPIPPAP